MSDTRPDDSIDASEQRVVSIRRSPRFGRLMVLGAGIGAIVGFVSGMLGEPDPELGRWPMVGFLLVIGIVAGIALGGLVAIILDATVGRRTAQVQAVRTSHREPPIGRGSSDDRHDEHRRGEHQP